MFDTIRRSTSWKISMALVLLTSVGACAHVSQEDLDGRLTAMRTELTQEMQQGDQQVSDAVNRRIDETDARVAALRADLTSLEQDFDVKVAAMEDALRFDVPVYFGFDEARVQSNGQEVLSRFGKVAKEYYPEAKITVEGFADPSGSEAYNLALGKRRADAVMQVLVSGGLPANQVKAVSYGEDTRRLVAPGAMGPGTTGWENRRVVLVIDHTGAMGAAAVADGEGGR
jgi:peptidoglycan-associated lipoprotein